MANKKGEVNIHSSAAEYLTYIAAFGDDTSSFEMRYQEENIWLTQKMMAEVYDISVAAVNQHIKRIFDDGELAHDSVIKEYLITATDGKNYKTKHYSLQMTIAVGFKVNNNRAEVADIFNQLNESNKRLVVRGNIKQWNQLLAEAAHNAGVITDENIHYAVAEKIRKAMIDIGATLPEDLPAADKSIKVAEREEIIKLRQSKKPLMIDE